MHSGIGKMQAPIATGVAQSATCKARAGIGETASTFVMRELKSQIASLYIRCMNGETHTMPRNPILIFTQEELDDIRSSRQRIFYSYFSVRDAKLRTKIDFEPNSEFEYLLIGIYYRNNGMDNQFAHLLERRPELFIFTLPNYFVALFTPHLPHNDFRVITISPDHEDYPLFIILDGETYDCLELADRLHGSPLLRDITFHMSANHYVFKQEIARREKIRERESSRAVEEMA